MTRYEICMRNGAGCDCGSTFVEIDEENDITGYALTAAVVARLEDDMTILEDGDTITIRRHNG